MDDEGDLAAAVPDLGLQAVMLINRNNENKVKTFIVIYFAFEYSPKIPDRTYLNYPSGL